jgi:hypothetical protein
VLGNTTFQHLTVVINGSPEVICHSIYLYEDLVQVPLPVQIRLHPTDPVSSYLSSKHWTKSIPPKLNRFVADLNASFVQKICDHIKISNNICIMVVDVFVRSIAREKTSEIILDNV